MALNHVAYASIALLAMVVLSALRTAFKAGLRDLPGPFWARFTKLYRLFMVYNGNAPAEYLKLHDKYGPVVRVGPNHVAISDPRVIPQIYGIGSDYLKTDFYVVFTPYYKGEVMDNMFNTTDPTYHKAVKRPVAHLYSMTNMKRFETYADECTKIFIDSMRELQGQQVDLGAWLQWYAFDVIASITFQRRFGFLEQRRDVDHMIADLDFAFWYAKIIGQIPGFHPFLVGNKPLLKILGMLGISPPDPMARFLSITEEEISRYDNQSKDSSRTDFLAQLRAKDSNGSVSERDLVNHLSGNILAGSDTTAISLRSVFYYLMKDPSKYKKLVSEIDEAEKNNQLSDFVTYEECLKLPYLQAVVKESLRIHPGVSFPLERYVPPAGADLSGYALPGGTNVSVNPAVVHLDKDVFGHDAHKFRPERWLEASPEQLTLMERSFVTFGYGARTCIGKNISIMEMGKLVPQILRYLDVKWASSEGNWKTDAAWFWKQSGIIVKFEWRGKSF